MELSKMSIGIKKIINKQYSEYMDDYCIDLIQIINICNLYKIKQNFDNDSINLSEINLSSPKFKKIIHNK